MRKRKTSDDESSEMEVDDEEKAEVNDDDADEDTSDDEEDEDFQENRKASTSAMIENPFLDSFYSLSSEDAKERSKAAQTMLDHCLLSSAANSKDASYAFRRLLNGICSGRAAARQGNASALASFLKLAFHLEKMDEIREERNETETESLSLLAYVRHRLMAATYPNQSTGKKKGSEERDYQFGRLFGILSIVRSNILISHSKENPEDAKNVATSLASDLAELFWLKKWMREPAAHGITTLLRPFCETSSKNKVAKHLVEEVVIPKILLMNSSGDEGGTDHTALVASFSPEQLGIALFVQSQTVLGPQTMTFPLNHSILSKETVELCAQALSETSSVVQPRMHFVWDSLWNYISRPMEKPGKKNTKDSDKRALRDTCPGGDESTKEVLDLIIRQVVMQRLLRIDPEKTSSSGKATHERRALALCIIKIVSGVPYTSSVSGASRIVLPGDVLEHSLLSPEIIRSLFLDVICAGSEKKKTSHLLKPLALEVLKEISGAIVADTSDSSEARRLAVAKALLGSEIRFDARTKTSTVSDLLGLMRPIQEGNMVSSFSFWNEYLEYLLGNLLGQCSAMGKGDNSAQANGYVELIYSFAKHILRLQTESEEQQIKLARFKNSVVDRILKFFLAAAFFNCEDVSEPEGKTPKKKKGKKTKKDPENPLLDVAQKVKETQIQGAGIAHGVRSVISARFFSLLSDFSSYATHASTDDKEDKLEKDSTTLGILVDVCGSWKSLEALGAKTYSSQTEAGDLNGDESADPEDLVSEMHKMVKASTEMASKDPENLLAASKKRCCTGMAVLGFSLYLHRLSCGEDVADSEDPDADDENDEEEICNALEGLKEVSDDFMGESVEDSNPLLGLAELCANILSSPLGSGNMGRAASPKLIRESVKFAWLGGLRLASVMATDDRSLLDNGVIEILLEAIGLADQKGDGREEDESDDEADDDDSNDDESMDENVFSKAMDVVDDPENMQVEEEDPQGDSEDSDLELDPSKLQSMLEEDSDADVDEDVLEHHEGADAALAKLIKLKQDARKAGKQAREKIEIGHQLRSTFLLELLFGRPDAWNRLFATETLLAISLPMLKHRQKLERSVKKSMESSNKSGMGEKQALLDRLTNLLNQKICKIKVASLPLAKPLSTETASQYASKILAEASRADTKEQSSCCNSCLVFLLRSTSDAANESALATICEEAAAEWSTKRTTKLQANLFDDLIVHLPELSQTFLTRPLSKASLNARSPFLKAESFRLLTLLFATQLGAQDGEAAKAAEKSLGDARDDFLASVEAALQDEEMRKAKRVRVVLKALEKFVAGLVPPASKKTYDHLETIKGLLGKLGEGESQGVSAMCTKLMTEMDAKTAELKESDAVGSKEHEEASQSAAATGEWDASKSKKKKKKKKKR